MRDKHEKTEDQVEALFHAALRLDPEEQAAFLERECGKNKNLREEVLSLLSAMENKPEILNLFARTVWNRLGKEQVEGTGDSLEPHDPMSVEGLPFERISAYRLVRKLGEGGMSVVYEALQEKPARKVAVKLMKHVAYSTAAKARFENEGRILARLRHPGIAQVIETGTHSFEGGDIPFLVMEYIADARPITGYADDADLSLRARIEKFIEVCDIVHFGHQKGIIHRDLKPANLLVDDEGRVKVIDFGVARVTNADVALTRTLTLTGQFIGTLSYMAPEQCSGRPGDVDMRCDVYTLGVTLYRLLCGRLPYELGNDGWMEAAEKIRSEPPLLPSSVMPGIDRDVETILLKALEKEREHRYPTVFDLRSDLQRFLDGEVILARPATLGTQVRKYARRNPLIVSTAGIALFFIIAWLGYSLLWAYPRIRYERNQAQAEQDKAVAGEKVKQEQLSRIQRLSDQKLLDELEDRQTLLWPAHPEMAPALQDWLIDAEAVINRLELHQSMQAQLATQGQDSMHAGSLYAGSMHSGTAHTGGTSSLGNRPEQWYAAQLDRLVDRITEFKADESGMIESVRSRLDLAKKIEHKSLTRYADQWKKAVASVADPGECPAYDGFRIKPVIGLAPLGLDRDSGLWEFAHVASGDVPKRSLDGKLQITDETCIVLVLIPGGRFVMGAGKLPPGATVRTYVNEVPQHDVNVPPFFMSKYEMTQGQWLRATGRNPSVLNPEANEREDYTLRHPVESVSWDDCFETLFHLDLRFPTESEWEYGARGGQTTIWAMGDKRESLGGAANLCDQAYVRHTNPPPPLFDEWLDDGFLYHAPVGSFKPNRFGLHDVHGNLWEWCQDFYHYNYTGAPQDGSAWETLGLAERVYRGGGFDFPSQYCKLTFRHKHVSHFQYPGMGVRPARSLGE